MTRLRGVRIRFLLSLSCLCPGPSWATSVEAPCGYPNRITQAIQSANSSADPFEIYLNPQGYTEYHIGYGEFGLCTYTLTKILDETDGSNGFPAIRGQVTIHGNGSVIRRDDGESVLPFRLFYVAPGGRLTLEDVVLEGGRAEGGYGDPSVWRPFSGGAVFNRGTLELAGSTVSGNLAGINGGGIYSTGTLIVRDSAIVDNEAGTSGRCSGGGGLAALGGVIEIRDSTIARNRGASGVSNDQGTMSIVNATIVGNSQKQECGGTGGLANVPNGGPFGPLTLVNTILAGNSGSDPSDCYGELISRGHNIIGRVGTCNLSDSSTDIEGAPGLQAFDPTALPGRAHYPLAADSPAIAGAAGSECSPTDQLGRPRRGECDLGAVEAPGVEIYVALTGNDENAGTREAPFGHIQHAVDVAAPGDTIYLRGGVYREESPLARFPQAPTGIQVGTPGFPKRDLRIAAYPGERPILKGSVVARDWERFGNLWRKSDWPVEPQLVFRSDHEAEDGMRLEQVGWMSDWYFANPKYCPLGSAHNILAVEVHQASGEPDMRFALEVYDKDSGQILVPRDAYWSYFVGGSEPPTAHWTDECERARYKPATYESEWHQAPPANRLDRLAGAYPPGVPYQGWPRRRTPFGYPRGEVEGTDLETLPNTTYFRLILPPIYDPTEYSLALRLWADDAAIVYLNGEELDLNGTRDGKRLNLPNETITFDTFALTPIDGAAENDFIEIELDETRLSGARATLAALAEGRIQLRDTSAGAFFYDRHERALYLWLKDGSDPNRHVIEVGRMAHVFDSNPSRNVRVEGLAFRHSNFANLDGYNNTMVALGPDSVISDSDIRWGPFGGVSLGPGSHLLDSTVSHHAMVGVGGGATGLLVRGNTVTHNGYLKGGGWDSGGMKFIPDAAGVIEDNEVAWNDDQAIWFDTCNSGEPIVIRRNYVHHNGSFENWAGEGIFIEISSNATIENNLLVDNSIVSIHVNDSSNVDVLNNTIIATHGHADAKLVWQERLDSDGKQWRFENNRFINNLVFGRDDTEVNFSLYTDELSPDHIRNNESDCNLFFAVAGGAGGAGQAASEEFSFSMAPRRGVFSLEDWKQATPWDNRSKSVDPQFSSGEKHPYLPTSQSPAVDEGCDVPVEADIRGLARPRGLDFDIGAYEVLVHTRNDFDGDGKSDLVLFDADQGLWHIRLSSSGEVITERLSQRRRSRAVPTDFDGDGRTDPAVFERWSGRWKIRYSGSGEIETRSWGSGGQGAPGDYDGDLKADLAVYDKQRGKWRVLRTSDSQTEVFDIGGPSFAHVPGDYDGDGRLDPAVFDQDRGLWRARLSGSDEMVDRTLKLGNRRVAARDFDGDGAAELATIHRVTGAWTVIEIDGSVSEPAWGPAQTYPVPGDYDGDGLDDLAVYDESTGEWNVLLSASNTEWHHRWQAADSRPLPIR